MHLYFYILDSLGESMSDNQSKFIGLEGIWDIQSAYRDIENRHIKFVKTDLYCPFCGLMDLYCSDVSWHDHVIHICRSCEASYYISGEYDHAIGECRKQFRDQGLS